jgi:hypothetical protein
VFDRGNTAGREEQSVHEEIAHVTVEVLQYPQHAQLSA